MSDDASTTTLEPTGVDIRRLKPEGVMALIELEIVMTGIMLSEGIARSGLGAKNQVPILLHNIFRGWWR